jgi:hypothetical protein
MIEDLYDIHLGNSLPAKAVSGALNYLGYGSEEVDSVLLWGSAGDSEEIKRHIYHLRYIYELTGAGLIDANGNPSGLVDFIVYNDPSSDAIYVKSTAEILVDVLE